MAMVRKCDRCAKEMEKVEMQGYEGATKYGTIKIELSDKHDLCEPCQKRCANQLALLANESLRNKRKPKPPLKAVA